jgi:hypothetical protein
LSVQNQAIDNVVEAAPRRDKSLPRSLEAYSNLVVFIKLTFEDLQIFLAFVFSQLNAVVRHFAFAFCRDREEC